jgi:hypothetical protein
MQPRNLALEHDKARARQLGAGSKIKADRLTEIDMVARRP